MFNFSGLQLIMLNKIIVVCSCAQITDQKVNRPFATVGHVTDNF